jgi:hypothetical protein
LLKTENRMAGLKEVAKFFGPAALAGFAIYLLSLVRDKRSDKEWRSSNYFIFGFCAAVFIFSIATGKNWGYWGRMQLGAWLPFLCLFVPGWWKTLGLKGTLVTLSAIVILGHLTTRFLWLLAFCAFGAHLTPSQSGLYKFLVTDNKLGKEMVRVNPEAVRFGGDLAAAIQRRLKLDHICLMTPDVGGTALCCDGVRIVDSACLANSILAHKGYSALGQVLSMENPEIIDLHWQWGAPLLYDKDFINDYHPILVCGNLHWLRLDIYSKIRFSGMDSSSSHFNEMTEGRHEYFSSRYPILPILDIDYLGLKNVPSKFGYPLLVER